MWQLVLGALALAAPQHNAPPAPALPKALPAAETVPADGIIFSPVNETTYADVVVKPHAGRLLLVNFWASYCLPCLEEMPALLKLREQLKDDVDVVFVSTDDPAALPKAGKVLKRWKIDVPSSFFVEGDDPDPFLAAVDPKWLGAIPHTIIYGRDGAILRKLPGAQTATTFEESLRAAILASPPAPSSATGSTAAGPPPAVAPKK